MPETCIRFGKLGARVMIEDEEVQHYAIHVDPAQREVSCWIASEEGKEFSVVWLEFDVEYPSGGTLYLDGHPADCIQRESAEPIEFRETPISELSDVPFLFSPLDVTDDDTYLDTSPHSIGEIKLVIERTTVPELIAEEQHTYFSPPHLQKVHERSKKAIAHRVNYGSEIPGSRSTMYSVKTVEKLVTFIFKYRPLEMLRANDIVPRNPDALDARPTSETSSGKGKHSKVENELESGSEDEDSMREKALLAEVERIRKRRDLKDSKRPKKKLKMEEKPLFIPGEIIDLTL